MRAQVAALSWPEFCRLWKDYIDVMSHALRDASTTTDSAAAQRLARLVYETGAQRPLLLQMATLSDLHRQRFVWQQPLCQCNASACAHQIQSLTEVSPVDILCFVCSLAMARIGCGRSQPRMTSLQP